MTDLLPPISPRQAVYWIPKSRSVAIEKKPLRVWTLTGHGRCDPNQPPTLPLSPVHGHGAFLEDHLHDWRTRKSETGETLLLYYSRVCSHSCWVLVEYHP